MAINVNELRFGNLVYEEVLGVCRVVSILGDIGAVDIEVINLKLDNTTEKVVYRRDVDSIEPIQLTPEIAANCKPNFAKKGLKSASILYNVDLQLAFLCVGLDTIKIQYLHDFQNIAFDFTKEELLINL